MLLSRGETGCYSQGETGCYSQEGRLGVIV